MAKRSTYGTGITQKVRIGIESAEDMRDWESWNDKRNSSGDPIAHIEAQAREILQNAGLPVDPAAYWDRQTPEVQSLQWYALEVLRLSEYLNREVAMGNARSAAKWGVFLGQLWQEARMKYLFEPDVLERHRQRNKRRESGKEGGKAVRKDVAHKRWKDEADRIRGELASKGKAAPKKSYLAKMVKKNLRLEAKIDTISRKI